MKKRAACVAFGTIARRLREAAGLSQEELAAKAGIHRTYIGGIERGERNPTLLMIHRLAKALGTKPGQLFEQV
jgi:transcriptional regulator with XRE-family HTH domain